MDQEDESQLPKRRRVARACDECRRKKVRLDAMMGEPSAGDGGLTCARFVVMAGLPVPTAQSTPTSALSINRPIGGAILLQATCMNWSESANGTSDF